MLDRDSYLRELELIDSQLRQVNYEIRESDRIYRWWMARLATEIEQRKALYSQKRTLQHRWSSERVRREIHGVE